MRHFLFAALLCLVQGQPRAQQPQVFPTLTVDTGNGKTTLEIKKIDIQVTVTGNIASTVYDITFYNPFDRILEGAFEFPLADGQSIYRYGLDINGNMREGVVVEKQQARVAYESTVRQNIDPGIIEKTKGNSYRTRIYPIPAQGTKRVLIGIEQALQYRDKELLYHLPVQSRLPVESLSVNATVYNSAAPVTLGNTPGEFAFEQKQNDWTAKYQRGSFTPDTEFRFSIPFHAEAGMMSFTGAHKGDTYFYLALPMQLEYVEKKLPSTVTLLWDVSASGAGRDIKREMALLQQYLEKLANATITLIPFNNVAGKAETFSIRNGNSSALVERIKKFDYDGGTQLGSINLVNDRSEQVLLFTDGIATFGRKEIATGTAPVALVNSATTAEHSYMKYVAAKTNGIYLDLGSVSVEEALRSLVYSPVQLVKVEHKPGEITDVVTSSGNSRGGISVAGILKTTSADITLHFGYGSTILSSIKARVSKEEEDIATVPRSWATMRIDELEMRPKENKQAITKTGKEFSVVTSNTSLIVLDRVEDYVQHAIIPPAELRSAYDSLVKEKQKADALAVNDPLERSVALMKELKDWYQKPFAKKVQQVQFRKSKITTQNVQAAMVFSPPDPATLSVMEMADSAVTYNFSTSGDRSAEVNVTATDSLRREYRPSPASSGAPGAAAQVQLRGITAGFDQGSPLIIVNGRVFNGYLSDIPAGDIISVSRMDDAAASSLYGSRAANGATVVTTRQGTYSIIDTAILEPEGSIEVQEWKRDAEYMKQLEKAAPADFYKTYVSLKEKYKEVPAFYVDAASLLYKRGLKALALQVLSNVAELQLEDAELMRILGHQLQEWNEKQLSLETFEDVKEMRAEHPQSWRDLALAQAEAGKYQEAADGLYHILTHDWDDRFSRLVSVVLSEFNAILGAHPAVNTAAYDKRLIYKMPVDVRIVITWSSDDSDVDLWVNDPLNEQCDYTFALTKGGGRLSGDITQGFGPEEYMMKKAVNGNYVVSINYFGDQRQTLAGPVTVKAEMYTNYGKPNQKKQVINLRLSSKKEVLKIGTLKFTANQ